MKVADFKDSSVDIVIIIDASGSMDIIGREVVDGFNQFIEKQLEDASDAFITVSQFNIENKFIKKREKLSRQAMMNYKEYVPCGMTALFDSVKENIDFIANKTKNNKVIVCIITDGLDNSSKTKIEDIKELISKKEKDGWKFVFNGADFTETSAKEAGFDNYRVFNPNAQGVFNTYIALGADVSNYRTMSRKSL